MKFASGINRPPYETADGYLQTTEDCSHNHWLFCTYFKDRKFRKSTIEEIEADIKQIPMYFGAPKRIFLQGADGFAADYDVLMKMPSCCTNTFPRWKRYLDSIEVSGNGTSVAGIKAGVNEAYFNKFALALAENADIPVILVGGHRSIDNSRYAEYHCLRAPCNIS